ncbi:MAG TPA: RHS repeat-associated core domain-containing protein, partial [Brumimicrobium sp.]|nr:RHS repeat-associated core domain-containing protein [Brumimicrobium sp.]
KWKVTYYSYDANGQLMATYNSDLYNGTIKETKLEEQYIYGSKRVGVIKANKVLYDEGPVQASTSPIKDNFLGKKRYELTNHLGNVLVTVSDRKVWNNTDGNYEPVITMKADYYAFGMLMPGRNEGISDARHLFNGMEHDMEVSGEGNSYTTEFRQYDPRLGRWKSLDPLMGIQAHLSPYQAFNNNPIYFVDPLGLIGGPAKEMPNYDLSDGEPEKVQDLEGITVKADLNVKSPSFLKQMWWNATGSWHKSRAMKTASIVGARESQMTELDENTILLRTGIEGTDNSLYSVFRKSKKNKSFTEYFSVKSNDDLFLTIDDVMDEDFILLSSIVLDAPDPATSTVKGGLVLMKHGGGFFRLLLKGRKAFSTKQAKQKVRFGVGGADDVLNKGFHVHIDGLEFGLRPGGGGQIGITQVGKKSSSLLQVNHAVKVFERAMSNKIFRDELLIHLKKTQESLLSKYGKGSINYQRAVDKSHEIHYLIQSLLNY